MTTTVGVGGLLSYYYRDGIAVPGPLFGHYGPWRRISTRIVSHPGGRTVRRVSERCIFACCRQGMRLTSRHSLSTSEATPGATGRPIRCTISQRPAFFCRSQWLYDSV